MTNILRGASLLILASLLTVGVSWKLHLDATDKLNSEINRMEDRFAQMQAQHQAAIAAGEKAAAMRDQIYSLFTEAANDLEKSLASCPDISNLELPDSLRQALSGACRPLQPATGQTDGANPAARQEQCRDSR